VSQEAVLFADTIEANIKLGRPEATMEDVIAAAKAANCHDFISSFPLSYKEFIDGTKVSGTCGVGSLQLRSQVGLMQSLSCNLLLYRRTKAAYRNRPSAFA
jgi:ABC-type protease/lipase transport system fused ATPase/permease subunit